MKIEAFQKRVIALANNSEKLASAMHELGFDAVKTAYADRTHARYEKVRFMLANVPQFAIESLVSWFRSMGIMLDKPEKGLSGYRVSGIADESKQQKMFEKAKAKPILLLEHKVQKGPRQIDETKTPEQRAQAYVDSALKRATKSDPKMAKVLAERLGAPKVEKVDVIVDLTLVGRNGVVYDLSEEEFKLLETQYLARQAIIASQPNLKAA